MKFDHYKSSKNSGEWMWSSRVKLCQIDPSKRNDSRVSLQELDFVQYSLLKFSRCVCHNDVMEKMSNFTSSGLGLLPRIGKYD